MLNERGDLGCISRGDAPQLRNRQLHPGVDDMATIATPTACGVGSPLEPCAVSNVISPFILLPSRQVPRNPRWQRSMGTTPSDTAIHSAFSPKRLACWRP